MLLSKIQPLLLELKSRQVVMDSYLLTYCCGTIFLPVLKENLRNMIAITQSIIKSQRYPDPYAPEDDAAAESQIQSLNEKYKDNPEALSEEENTFATLQHDQVFNEHKKDFLQVLYDAHKIIKNL